MRFKTVFLPVLAGVLMLSGVLTGCADMLQGSGKLETRQMDFSDFNKLDVSYAFEVEVTRGDSYHVAIAADDNLFDHLQVNKSGSTLKIGLKPLLNLRRTTLRAEVTMPELAGIELSGASQGTVTGFGSTADLDVETSGASSIELADISAGDVDVKASGASRITGDLKAGDVRFNVSGASTVQFEGSGGNIDADVSGASHLKLAVFPVNDADVSFSGASDGTINASGKLDVDLSGASKLVYLGEPRMGSMNISGGSKLSND